MKSEQDSVVQGAEPRQTAQVRFPDGRILEAPVGTQVEDYVKAAFPDGPVPVVAALVNGELRELNYTMRGDGRIDPVLLSDSDGVRIYRRSLAFLLMTAVRELFPEAHVFVEYSLPFGGFFCQVRGREPFSVKELAQLETHMRRIVAEAAPITKERVPLDQAIELFNDRDEPDKARLLPRRKKDYLVLYNLRGSRDYFHGYMVPSTGYLRCFALRIYPPGFLFQYPRPLFFTCQGLPSVGVGICIWVSLRATAVRFSGGP